MANLQVKNVPADLNRRLHAQAAAEQRSLRELILAALQRELDRRAFVARLRRRPAARLKTAPAVLLSAERRARGLER